MTGRRQTRQTSAFGEPLSSGRQNTSARDYELAGVAVLLDEVRSANVGETSGIDHSPEVFDRWPRAHVPSLGIAGRDVNGLFGLHFHDVERGRWIQMRSDGPIKIVMRLPVRVVRP